jgi:hypothetical protein
MPTPSETSLDTQAFISLPAGLLFTMTNPSKLANARCLQGVVDKSTERTTCTGKPQCLLSVAVNIEILPVEPDKHVVAQFSQIQLKDGGVLVLKSKVKITTRAAFGTYSNGVDYKCVAKAASALVMERALAQAA